MSDSAGNFFNIITTVYITLLSSIMVALKVMNVVLF